MTRQRPQRGFTLIELMVVVGIIGMLASIAMPTFQKLALRTKTAERTTIMLRIKQAVQDYYLRTGSSVPLGGPAVVTSGTNPSPPETTLKRMMRTDLANWNLYFSAPGGGSSVTQEIEGAVYYTYSFRVEESAIGSTIQVVASGDLDGDNLISSKLMQWTRESGVYQLSAEVPGAGFEDDPTF